jgi:hypothetical protein
MHTYMSVGVGENKSEKKEKKDHFIPDTCRLV